MTAEACDSFGLYADSGQFARVWNAINGNAPTFSQTGGPDNRPCINVPGDNSSYTYVLPGGSLASRSVSCRFMTSTVYGASFPIVALVDSGTRQIDVRMLATGQITVTRNGTVLATSTSPVIAPGAWNHFALYATINNTTGAYKLRVNGAVVAGIPDATNVNTRATANNSANQVGIGGGAFAHLSDLYVDTAEELRDLLVQVIRPTGAGNTTQGTPNGAASDWDCVNDTTSDDDTTYVSEDTAGEKDTYVMEDASPAAGVVLGLQLTHVVRKDDAGTRTYVAVIRSGGTDFDQSAINPGNGYTMDRRMVTTNPATAAAWTLAGINAVQVGQKVTV